MPPIVRPPINLACWWEITTVIPVCTKQESGKLEINFFICLQSYSNIIHPQNQKFFGKITFTTFLMTDWDNYNRDNHILYWQTNNSKAMYFPCLRLSWIKQEETLRMWGCQRATCECCTTLWYILNPLIDQDQFQNISVLIGSAQSLKIIFLGRLMSSTPSPILLHNMIL